MQPTEPPNKVVVLFELLSRLRCYGWRDGSRYHALSHNGNILQLRTPLRWCAIADGHGTGAEWFRIEPDEF